MHPDLKNIGVACSPFGLGRCSRGHVRNLETFMSFLRFEFDIFQFNLSDEHNDLTTVKTIRSTNNTTSTIPDVRDTGSQRILDLKWFGLPVASSEKHEWAALCMHTVIYSRNI